MFLTIYRKKHFITAFCDDKTCLVCQYVLFKHAEFLKNQRLTIYDNTQRKATKSKLAKSLLFIRKSFVVYNYRHISN